MLHRFGAVAASRYLTPLVLGLFLLIYIGIAFVTDETLIALMELTRSSVLLALVLALLPLNSALRLALEAANWFRRGRLLQGGTTQPPAGLFDESVELAHSYPVAQLEPRLAAQGYRTRGTSSGGLGAWRGIGLFPARICYLAGVFCLFAGILISLTGRSSNRGAVIEGVRMPTQSGQGGMVERIRFTKGDGPILSKNLVMEVADPGTGTRSFGLYPPSLYQGAFVYPRYLGVGLHFNFSAPDLPVPYDTRSILAIHPPGKEAAAEIPDSPYQLVFTLAQPADGSDPYMTGNLVVQFKLLKGKELVLTGNAPAGGEVARDGYRIAFPDLRRLVITDFISDYGVYLIWASALLFLVAFLLWLPVRLCSPRREMLFATQGDGVRAFSRAEGRERSHRGVFHEALDLLEGKRPGGEEP